MIIKFFTQKTILSPRRRSNPQLSDDWSDALTIVTPRLRWRAKVQKLHQSLLIYSGFRLDRTYISNLYISQLSESRCLDGQSVSPVISRLRVRSPSGAQNRFLSKGLDDHSFLLRYIQALTFLKQKLHQSLLICSGFRLERHYILVLQDKAVRLMTLSKFDSHSSPLF